MMARFALLPFLLLLGSCVSTPTHYVMIDAGSSGSRVFIYHLSHHGSNGTRLEPLLGGDGEVLQLKQKPGLSSFASPPKDPRDVWHVADPSAAFRSVKPLLEFAIRHLPSQGTIASLHVLGTAGLRVLSVGARQVIFDAILRGTQAEFPGVFQVQPSHLRVLSGQVEGMYGWLTVNYALGRLDGSYTDTIAAVDMGGGSMQLTFAVPTSLSQAPKRTTLPAFQETFGYKVYVHSFLGWGANSALNRHVSRLVSKGMYGDPCMLKGQRAGFRCKPVTKATLHDAAAAANRCHETQPLVVGGQPASEAGQNMLPRSNDKFDDKDNVIVGTGNFEQCKEELLPLLNLSNAGCGRATHDLTAGAVPGERVSEDTWLPEGMPLTCMINNIARPPLPPHTTLYGMSEYWYSSRDLFNLQGRFDPDVYVAAARKYCASSYVVQASTEHPLADLERVRSQCFKATWLSVVHEQGLGFKKQFSKDYLTTVSDSNSWTYGAALDLCQDSLLPGGPNGVHKYWRQGLEMVVPHSLVLVVAGLFLAGTFLYCRSTGRGGPNARASSPWGQHRGHPV